MLAKVFEINSGMELLYARLSGSTIELLEFGDEYMELNAKLVMELSVDIGEIQVVGKTSKGYLRVIPITGGTFSGDICGEIIPGGADWNTRLNNGLTHVFAKYTMKTDDGVYISVENEGYLEDGLSKSLIKTVPKFQVEEDGKYGWLEHGVFVASLNGKNSDIPGVCIKVYKLQ
jgi:hypothetical protein